MPPDTYRPELQRLLFIAFLMVMLFPLKPSIVVVEEGGVDIFMAIARYLTTSQVAVQRAAFAKTIN